MARIAIGGFQHETNTFTPSLATLADFEAGGAWPELTTGPGLPDRVRGMNLSIAGFVDEAERLGHRLLPTTWGAASPSSYVTEHACEHIAGLILDGLRAADTGARRLRAGGRALHLRPPSKRGPPQPGSARGCRARATGGRARRPAHR